MNEALTLTAVLLTAGVFYLFVTSTHSGPTFEASASAPKLSVPIAMVGLDGSPVSFEENFAGKTVLLNIWSTSCPPCIREMPSLQRLHTQLKNDKDIVVVCLAADNNLKRVASFAKSRKLTLPIFVLAAPLPPEISINFTPHTIVLDKDQRVRFEYTGATAWDNADAVAFLREIAGSEPVQ